MQNITLYFGDNLEILREKFTGDGGYFDFGRRTEHVLGVGCESDDRKGFVG